MAARVTEAAAGLVPDIIRDRAQQVVSPDWLMYVYLCCHGDEAGVNMFLSVHLNGFVYIYGVLQMYILLFIIAWVYKLRDNGE